MELTLKHIPMEGYSCPLDTVLYQEETQESIVPDACPDILTIVATEGCAQLTRKESADGKVEVSGVARLTVLYLPDGEEGPRSLTLNVPFRASAGAPGMAAGCPLVAVPKVVAAETRVLNPRKVLARVELAVSVQGYAALEESLCAPGDEEHPGLQQRMEETERYVAVAAVEKAFGFSDEVTLTASRPGAQELLGHRLDLRCAEAKVIGSKLVFKGEVILEVRYRSLDNGLAVGRWELPFSQILECSGLSEDGQCGVEVVERESHVTLTGDEDGRTISVQLELLAQSVVRSTCPVKLFTDAYSVRERVTVERKTYTFTQLHEESSAQHTVREVGESPMAAQSVEDCFVSLGCPQTEREGDACTLTCRGTATVLCTGESPTLFAVTVPFTAQCQVKAPEGAVCKARCALAGEVQALATTGGIEVRVPVQFFYRTTVEKTCSGVEALTAEDLEEGLELPSVILRLAQPGECLWDIAKAYSTTEGDILAANDLPDPEHLEGALLLIPRSR